MNIPKTLLIVSVLSISLYSQINIDTTNWYPLEIGNKWKFSYGLDPEYYFYKEVIGDTIMPNGKNYAIIKDGANLRYQRNHDNQYVYSYNGSDSSEYILYDFISSDSTFWEVPFENYYWGIQVTKIEFDYYLMKNTSYKHYDWVAIDSSNNDIDTIWNAMLDIYPTRIAQGIGVTSYNYSQGPGSSGLVGAIIDGDTLGTITGVNNSRAIQNDFRIYQNYPNPFNPSTIIEFRIPQREHVQLNIFNSLGQKIAVLIDESLSNGNYKIKFDGQKYSSGVYLYQLKTKNYCEVKKMLLLK